MIELSQWIEQSGHQFLRNNLQFGRNYEMSLKFLSEHKDLFNRAHLKIFELEGLRGALKTISGQSSNEEVQEVEQIMYQLSNKLASLKSLLEVRIFIAEKCNKFYKLFGQLDKEMSLVEQQLEQNSSNNELRPSFEESKLLIQQLFLQVCIFYKNAIDRFNNEIPSQPKPNVLYKFI